MSFLEDRDAADAEVGAFDLAAEIVADPDLDPHQLSFAFSEVFAHVNAMLRLGELRWAEPQGETMKVMAAG